MKECTASYVVYIQELYVDRWRIVLERHIGVRKSDKCRVIFKMGDITITLYQRPKKDPRSKLHIQSGDQNKNLDFILEKLSMFYRDVITIPQEKLAAVEMKEMQKSLCGRCGKTFTNKRGLKQHIMRMHSSIAKRKQINKVVNVETVTLEEEPEVVQTPKRAVPNNMSEVKSLEPKKKTLEVSEKEQNGDDEFEFIKNLIGDIIDAFQSKKDQEQDVDINYQCGECGKMFATQTESDAHMESEH